jgi:hypothetical protein
MTTPHRPWSPHPPAHYQEPSTDPRGVENYLARQTQVQNPGYYDPYTQHGTWQPVTPVPPYVPGRHPSLPPNSQGYRSLHDQHPTDASVEALGLAEYSSRLNVRQQHIQSQPQLYAPQPPQPGYYLQSVSHPAGQTSRPTATQPQPPARDFIDIGPFTYTGIREVTPPPVRPPPARQSSPRRQQTREQSPSPARSAPARGHLPWASENDNEYDLGEPDPVFPPSSPHRNDSNNFPFNVQSAPSPSAHTAASETLAHSPGNQAGETSYFSPDPESHEDKKNWGVHEGEQPGDIGEDGKLISNGPRKRMAVRALEVLAATGACVACIYAFAVSFSWC